MSRERETRGQEARPVDPPRILAVSPPRAGPWLGELQQLGQAGVQALVLRLIDEPEALELALATVRATAPPGLRVLVRPVVAGDAERAQAHGLDLHLPDGAAPPPGWTRALATSAHDRGGLDRAAAMGCAWALISPVFPPGSKPGDSRPTLGLSGLAALCAVAPLPVLALGGVTPATVGACLRAGAAGVAGMGAFFRGGHVDATEAAAMVAAAAEAMRAG